jgi:hypothetical protein
VSKSYHSQKIAATQIVLAPDDDISAGTRLVEASAEPAVAILIVDALALDITKLLQPLPKALPNRCLVNNTDAPHPPLLRARRERPRCRAAVRQGSKLGRRFTIRGHSSPEGPLREGRRQDHRARLRLRAAGYIASAATSSPG